MVPPLMDAARAGAAASLETARVESIAAGISDADRATGEGALPAVNPTFSWVRLAQRIPVRVRLEKVPAGLRLISGRTATVTVQPAAKDAKPGDCRHA